MSNWRSDVKIIAEIISGMVSAAWRTNFSLISGGSPPNWREAIQRWAATYDVFTESWRNDLIGISKSLIPDFSPQNWREALKFIRMYYEGNPPEILFCLNTLPVQPNAIYRWMDSETWNDANFWIDRS